MTWTDEAFYSSGDPYFDDMLAGIAAAHRSVRFETYIFEKGVLGDRMIRALTDALIEEIYAIARESFAGGQKAIPVHAFPFRMTDANMERHKQNKWYRFWTTLKAGYDHFEEHRIPPNVAVCESRYIVNVAWPSKTKLNPVGRCPRFMHPQIEPFVPRPTDEQIAFQEFKAAGPKMRTVANNGMPTLVPYGVGMSSQNTSPNRSSTFTSNPLSALGFN